MAPRRYALSPNVFAVKHDGDLVFLDVRADAYYCVSQPGGDLRLCGPGRLAAASPAVAEALIAAGLIRADSAGRPEPFPSPAPPVASALALDYPPPSGADLGLAAAALADLGLSYWGRPFSAVLETARAGKPPVPETPPAGMLALVAGFHRWAPYAPTSAKCFLRSFMLQRLLSRAGFGADWVIGVRTWPFRAHCWLQCGGLVLDDDHERVAPFTPILVV